MRLSTNRFDLTNFKQISRNDEHNWQQCWRIIVLCALVDDTAGYTGIVVSIEWKAMPIDWLLTLYESVRASASNSKPIKTGWSGSNEFVKYRRDSPLCHNNPWCDKPQPCWSLPIKSTKSDEINFCWFAMNKTKELIIFYWTEIFINLLAIPNIIDVPYTAGI